MKMPSFEFYRRMNPRERVLSLFVGGAVLLLMNMVALSTLVRSSRELRTQYAEESQDLRLQSLFAQEEPIWKQRTQWLASHQPKTTNWDRAGTDLLAEVQAATKVSGVTLESFQITPQPTGAQADRNTPGKGDYRAASLTFETQSDWGSLVHFITAMQKPESFIVFDTATLRSAPNDATRMHGSFGLSKWYTAGGK